MSKFKLLLAVAGFALCLPILGQDQEADNYMPTEETLAWELLRLEGSTGNLPAGATALLQGALDNATEAAIATARYPANKVDALRVLNAITVELAKLNFIQPRNEKDWPQTIGQALTPRFLSKESFETNMEANLPRREYINENAAVYFLDCDIGSLIFLSVAQRAGWDMRLVEVPRHNFVRWHLKPWLRINWDWTYSESKAEDWYGRYFKGTPDRRWEEHYLRSLPTHEARAYYLQLLASETENPTQAESLFREALGSKPGHPLTLNNFAWFYATTPALPVDRYDLAVAYSLSAWSLRPTSANFADTVACAFSVRGDQEVALAIEEWAIRHEDDERKVEGYKSNRTRIAAGGICE